ncbi:MAG: TIGR04282 family arsenosugar biosynthesis glycosyltransferase [Pseudomonadota bacterium]
MAERVRICVFAKAPVPGSVKTRLIPALGADAAATLAARLLGLTLAEALASTADIVELTMAPAPDDPAWDGVTIPAAVARADQGSGGLSERLERAAARSLAAGSAAVLIGTDCPGLTSARLDQAMAALQNSDAVLIPALDGGFVLLGLRRQVPRLFDDVPWSSDAVAELTLRRLRAAGLAVWVGTPLRDIDDPDDLADLPAVLGQNPHATYL